MKKNRILVVDDDESIREVLAVLLGSEGFNVIQAENGYEAIYKVGEDPGIDLVVMDIMMPGISGVEACRKIREKSKAPILFLTAKSQEQDKVEAYTWGGDDYLVKPFSNTELLVKIKSLLRRYTEYQGKAVVPEKKEKMTTIGPNIVIDEKKHQALKEGRHISLTDKEFAILKFFLENKGEVISNKDIYEGVWGETYETSDGNTVMVHILNLRKKLESDINSPEIIKTVWGKGYQVE